MAHIDIHAVGCPACRVEAGKCCIEPKTARSTKTHEERISHAKAVHFYPKAERERSS